MKIQCFSITLLLLSTIAQAVEKPQEQSGLEKLEQKMQAIGSYYEQVNDKLNKRPNTNTNNSSNSTNDHRYLQPNTRRDPFSYTDQMYRNQPKQGASNNTENNIAANALLLAATTAVTADGLPIMKYRGYAESPTGEVIGIIEILGMGVYTVRVGDQIGLHDIIKELVLTVEGLSRNNIIIKTGKLGKKLVVQ